MSKGKYTAEFKTKVVLDILQGDKKFDDICAELDLDPGMVCKWKQEFLQNAHRAFDSDAEHKAAQRKEDDLKRKNDQMRKTIGQLTRECDFLQGCFRRAGEAIPRFPGHDSNGA